jgi:hypothetical protein
MKCKSSLVVLLCLAAPLAIAQNPALSVSAGIGPGNTFTLFMTLQDPMPKIDSIWCGFNLVGAPKPGQEDFAQNLNCVGPPKRDDETHYRVDVGVPLGIAAGDYKINQINFSVGGATHIYKGQDLPGLAAVPVSNPEHLKFSPIKKLEVKP